MKINGVYYTEPELASKLRQMQETIDRYEAENRKLTEENDELGGLYNDASLGIGYLEQRCEELETREKEYKRLLKAAVETFSEVSCNVEWRFKAEALKLIGETND